MGLGDGEGSRVKAAGDSKRPSYGRKEAESVHVGSGRQWRRNPEPGLGPSPGILLLE